MGEIKSHKDLEVWKEAMRLVEDIYKLSTTFPKAEMYGIVNQIRRASVSVPSNIAEGAARNSHKEFIQFLYISLGSLAELETQYLISISLQFTEHSQHVEDRILLIRKLLNGLIYSLKRKI